MSQFVHITGARAKETRWFSRSWYASGGQIGHNPLVAQLAAICQPVRREDKKEPVRREDKQDPQGARTKKSRSGARTNKTRRAKGSTG